MVTLVLTEQQARILKTFVQNPLTDDPLNYIEPREEEQLRLTIWEQLEGVSL